MVGGGLIDACRCRRRRPRRAVLLDPDAQGPPRTAEITVYERNQPTDAFGFGVVFSDETLTVFEHADPETYSAIAERFARWTDIDDPPPGWGDGAPAATASPRSAGASCWRILQERAASLGVDVRFSTEAPRPSELDWADLIVGGRRRLERACGRRSPTTSCPSLDRRHCRYMWLGTDLVFDAFKFFIDETAHGVFQAHAYPYDDAMSTFIVEMHERTSGASGPGSGSARPGESDEAASGSARELFADVLDGHRAVREQLASGSTSSRSATGAGASTTWCCSGDAAHTAHFSIGSGTKLAMEDAVALAWAFRSFGRRRSATPSPPTRPSVRPIVESTSAPHRPRSSGSRAIGRYVDQARPSSRSTC